jgi:TonB-dependent receptor
VSFGFFQKDVDNVIGSQITTENYEREDGAIITHPASGSRYDDAVANTGNNIADNGAHRAYIEANNLGDPYIEPGVAGGAATKIFGHPTENDQLQVDYSQPINQASNKVNGLEVAAQHLFGESGFGTIINFTLVDSDVEYDNTSEGDGPTPLLGVSDSANFIAFYDKDGIQVRFAYNWRDDFLSALNDGQGANPVYTEAYGQLDANVGYQFNENLTIFAEAINLTDETSRTYGRHTLMTRNIQQTGARYNVGLRYKF